MLWPHDMLCPHDGCQRELAQELHDAWVEDAGAEYDSTFTIHCPGCGRPVEATADVTVSFDVNVPEDYDDGNGNGDDSDDEGGA